MTLSAPGHDDPDTSPGATRRPPSLLGAVKDLTSLLTALVGLLAVLGAVTEKFGAWIPGAERLRSRPAPTWPASMMPEAAPVMTM